MWRVGGLKDTCTKTPDGAVTKKLNFTVHLTASSSTVKIKKMLPRTTTFIQVAVIPLSSYIE